MLVVGKGETFEKIQDAINSLHQDFGDGSIFIKKGIYNEKIVINIDHIKLIGEDKDLTKIIYNDYAKKLDQKGQPLETFRTYTVLINGKNVIIENISIINNSGLGDVYGQAIALFVNADQVKVLNCNLIGNQDTLLTGPIPIDAKNQEHLDFNINHHAVCEQFYENCFIKGDVDFIFGSANALFKNCIIFSNNLNKEVNGYISAPSTKEGQLGHIFYECQLISDAKKHSVYLGRPWRDFGNTVFINCYMGNHINPTGFSKWSGTDRHLHSRFFEYGSYGPGSIRECSLSKHINQKEALEYLQNFILKGYIIL